MGEPLLRVEKLKTHFFTFRGLVKAVDGVSFHVERGEAVGLVGESGSGKTVTGLSILRLVQPPGKILGDDILFDGRSLLRLSDKEMQKLRGSRIGMVFQNPRTCLNPVLAIGEQIDRVYRQHTGCSARVARERRLEMLERVSIGDPLSFSKRYPHELSGGMCQRAMIVMALICNPELIIADEPTTGLDVTIQRQIMDLLEDMRAQTNATQILITHDLGLVAESCDQVVVMYAGRVVESAPTQELFRRPAHPYTRGLLGSIPRPDMDREPTPMPGYVPSAANRPRGCAFHPRCPLAADICREQEPPLIKLNGVHTGACHFLGDGNEGQSALAGTPVNQAHDEQASKEATE